MNLALTTAKIQLELRYMQTMRQLTQLKENIRENGATWTDQSRLHDLQEQISRLQRAQERSLNDHYGLCVSCGHPISPERLNLVPDAELCMECHQKNVRTSLRNGHSVSVYHQ